MPIRTSNISIGTPGGSNSVIGASPGNWKAPRATSCGASQTHREALEYLDRLL